MQYRRLKDMRRGSIAPLVARRLMLSNLFICLTWCLVSTLLTVEPCWASEENWQKYTAAGKSAFDTSNFGLAERMYKAALKEAEEFGAKDIRLANSLTNLGVLYNCRGQATKATPMFERAIAVQQAALGPENPVVVASVGKLCNYYISHNELAKAEPIAQKMVQFSQKVVRDRQAVDSSFVKLNTFYQTHKQFQDAESLFKKAEAETRKLGSNEDLELAVLLDGLGESFKSSNKIALSEQLYGQALAIREQALPPTHAAISMSCSHLAQLFALEGKYVQAEPLYARAVQINRKAFGPEKEQTLASMQDLADCQLRQNKAHEAEELYRRQVDGALAAYGKNSKYTANAYIALAQLLLRTGRAGEAANFYGQALAINERLSGPQSASLSPILESYAEALDRSNRKSEAKKYLARARAIRG
jgi:tetratricopeptide (TPR) repeat protein